MRIISIFFVLIFSKLLYAQDTIVKRNLIIYSNGKIIQKEFYDKNYIKIIYQYNNSGVLVRRWWYDSSGKIIGVILDD